MFNERRHLLLSFLRCRSAPPRCVASFVTNGKMHRMIVAVKVATMTLVVVVATKDDAVNVRVVHGMMIPVVNLPLCLPL